MQPQITIRKPIQNEIEVKKGSEIPRSLISPGQSAQRLSGVLHSSNTTSSLIA